MATSFSQPLGIMNFLASSPDYGKMMSEGVKQNLMRSAGELASNSRIAGSGITGHFNKEGVKERAKGVIKQGAAEGNAAMYGGIASGVKGIAGGVFDRMGSDDYFGTGSTGIDSAGKYGSFDPGSVQRDLDRFNYGSGTLYSGFTNQGLG